MTYDLFGHSIPTYIILSLFYVFFTFDVLFFKVLLTYTLKSAYLLCIQLDVIYGCYPFTFTYVVILNAIRFRSPFRKAQYQIHIWSIEFWIFKFHYLIKLIQHGFPNFEFWILNFWANQKEVHSSFFHPNN